VNSCKSVKVLRMKEDVHGVLPESLRLPERLFAYTIIYIYRPVAGDGDNPAKTSDFNSWRRRTDSACDINIHTWYVLKCGGVVSSMRKMMMHSWPVSRYDVNWPSTGVQRTEVLRSTCAISSKQLFRWTNWHIAYCHPRAQLICMLLSMERMHTFMGKICTKKDICRYAKTESIDDDQFTILHLFWVFGKRKILSVMWTSMVPYPNSTIAKLEIDGAWTSSVSATRRDTTWLKIASLLYLLLLRLFDVIINRFSVLDVRIFDFNGTIFPSTCWT